MAGADDVRVTVFDTEIAALAGSNEARAYLLDVADGYADAARAQAPHRTGGGGSSIHATAVLDDGWNAHVGWDAGHSYMLFQDIGTKYMPGKHFMEHTLDRYTRL